MNTLQTEKRTWKQIILHELAEYWGIVLYLFLFFGVFTTYRRLILAQYEISYEDYGIGLIKALVLAKIVLVAEHLGLGRGHQDKPLIVPTLYKAFLFTLCAALFTIIESMIRSLIHGSGLATAANEMMNRINYEWLAGLLVLFFTFIPFFALREFRQILGEGMIHRLFFRSRSVIDCRRDLGKDTLKQ